MEYTTLEKVEARAAAVLSDGGRVVIYGPSPATRPLFMEIAGTVIDHEWLAHSTYSTGNERIYLENGGIVLTVARESHMLGLPMDLLIQFAPTRRGLIAGVQGAEVVDIRVSENGLKLLGEL